jgi:glutamyl-tRNA reductase
LVDLGRPRYVDPHVRALDGVEVADLEVLGVDLSAAELTEDVDQVRQLVEDEVEDYLTDVRVQSVAPTVVALRARAAEVVDAELSRLGNRVRDLEPGVREELEQTVHRVVEKLLHAPTVRVKELASRHDGGSYAAALRELFDLDPEEVSAISQVPSESDVAVLLTRGGPL